MCNKFGQTALHLAAARAYNSCVSALLRKSAPLQTKDGKGLTAEEVAKKKGHSSTVKLFPHFLLGSLSCLLYVPSQNSLSPTGSDHKDEKDKSKQVTQPKGPTLLVGHDLFLQHKTCASVSRCVCCAAAPLLIFLLTGAPLVLRLRIFAVCWCCAALIMVRFYLKHLTSWFSIFVLQEFCTRMNLSMLNGKLRHHERRLLMFFASTRLIDADNIIVIIVGFSTIIFAS